MPKREPAQLHLTYDVPAGTSYIDLARDLSRVNRRLYRQGMMYRIQNIQLMGPQVGTLATDVTNVGLYTISNSWIAHNAWKKGFKTWQAQIKSATALPDGGPGNHGRHYHGAGLTSIEGKWSDFKIYLDDAHEDGTTLDVMAGDGAAYAAGEWVQSKFVFDDDGTERELKAHMIGSSNLSDTNEESGIGLIFEYNISRARVNANDPSLSNSASDSIYSKMLGTDEMSDMLVDNIEGDNDNPPYDQDEFPGGATNADAPALMGTASVTATRPLSSVRGFDVPCGLIKVNMFEMQLDGSNLYEITTGPNHQLLITLSPGDYRGVFATPMGQ